MRLTPRGLAPNTLIRITNAASRRHARGRVVAVRAGVVEYRSAYNGGVYLAQLTQCRIDRSAQRRARSMPTV